MSRLMPRQTVPALVVETLAHGGFDLASRRPENFTLLVFYRGLHCPICRTYISELNGLYGDFAQRGVDVLALSSDSRERAERAAQEWGLTNLPVGYELAVDLARQWGLYVSTSHGKTSIGIDEPAVFSEPGVFLVRPDGTLYWALVQTMPFARPHFKDMLGAIDFVIANDYPARGEA